MDPIGKTIEARRNELGLSKVEASRRAGVNRGTWHDIEEGRRHGMLPNTLLRIDKAMRWDPGTTYRMISGTAEPEQQIEQSTARQQVIALIASWGDERMSPTLDLLKALGRAFEQGA